MKHVPNALTLLRLVLAPVIAWLYWSGATALQSSHGVMESDYNAAKASLAAAAALFAVAALTDLFDGMIARAFNAHSKLGRIIDPIADKALVGLPLIAIVWVMVQKSGFMGIATSLVAIAVGVIVVRDVLMTWIRLSSPDGEGARVSSLAKIKTALELFVVGAFLVGSALQPHLWDAAADTIDGQKLYFDLTGPAVLIWLALLVITAALSAYTGWQYLRPKR